MKYLAIASLGLITSLGALTACSNQAPGEAAEKISGKTVAAVTAETPKMDHSKIVTGNGENNFVILDGALRDGSNFTFPQVTINKDGFLVMHPFRDGKPVQTEYVGAVPLSAGSHKNVPITVDTDVQSQDNFIVMLHYDMNTDGVFDFNDGVTVPDAPVFEGHTLVALRYSAP